MTFDDLIRTTFAKVRLVDGMPLLDKWDRMPLCEKLHLERLIESNFGRHWAGDYVFREAAMPEIRRRIARAG